ncbi:NADPH:quinone reductase-like Zn-dependent oxidoreductase [Catenuloplanes nepalensis]|uniref:NADPH:quinone reductase-like Zn-dependent oxidoreductase n=1 Tax=Catenuloplanes nepalensis TaxID=587533 RepID=A0ABT9MV20_9ACTN|nr:NADP-dependent oxidoreductase [Catenuloplanes nepalensis]MDP9795078.1 NADPH:quinone reductase-like Zn-dependent oxidoreductase [Catenuloplanes nepalensis]
MRKIVQRVLGGPDVLEWVEADRPEPGPAEILVEVRAAGVNPVDWKVRAGGGYLGAPPFTVGWEAAGVVAAVGAGVTRFVPGDEVFGLFRFPREASAYAEYVTGPARHFAHRPRSMTMAQAGGLALAGLTAWQLLAETANVRAGQRVLIPAAAGGFGHLAVQIAKARGAHVIGTSTAEKHALVREFGADEVIDYRDTDVGDAVRDVDLAIGVVAGQVSSLVRTLRPDGMLITLNGADTAESVAAGGRFLLAEPDRAGLEELTRLVDDGRLRVHVDRALPLSRAAEAHRAGEAGRTVGKIVLTA